MKAYSRLLDKYPNITKISTTGFLFWLGDICSQKIEGSELRITVESLRTFDLQRNVRFTGFGTLLAGPIFIVYYNKFLPFLFRSTKPRTVLLKVVFDQTIWASTFLTYLFYTLSRLEGKPHNASWKHARSNVWPSLKVNWMIWPPVMFANFYLIPLKFQILVVNVVALFWNTFISYRNNL